MRSFNSIMGWALAGGIALAVSGSGTVADAAGQRPMLPEIRTSQWNMVPQCVTPERLMVFLKQRNRALLPQFREIAFHYRQFGSAWRVRWDYAFFQMAIETNFLSYRQPNGRMGDVDPAQNNFAGIGTTGGGVPGDRFPDVPTGVLGQIQHLVVYSGEPVQRPVAQRTALKQDHILAASRALNRPVRFNDLARRWAADPKYASSIEWVAESYRSQFCRGAQPVMDRGAQMMMPPQGAPSQTAPLRPMQPLQAPREILPWQRPNGPRAEIASSIETGSISVVSQQVRTLWSRDSQRPAQPVAKAGTQRGFQPAVAGPEAAADPPVPEIPTEDTDSAPLIRGAIPLLSPQAEVEESAPRDEGLAFVLSSPLLAEVAAQRATAGVAIAAAARALEPTLPPAAVDETPPPESAPPTAAAPAAVARAVQAQTEVPADTVAAQLDPTKRERDLATAQSAPGFDAAANPPQGLGAKPEACSVETASFGGVKTMLIKAFDDKGVHYIALTVLDGFEQVLTESFLKARNGDGETLGAFADQDAALARARELCPGA